MESQQSHGSTSMSKKLRYPPFPVYCYHDEVAPLRTVKYDGPTKGKLFYGCSFWPRTCGFFKWVDEVDDIRDLKSRIVDKNLIIMELEDKLELVKEKVKKLKAKQEKLVDDVAEVGIVATETLFEMKENNTDKKLNVALILSWAFFDVVFMMK
uniref:GRF-type domain-containing protein n=1 Tax=Chenopodium quinoa TaxID=63459 RepID=A0A803MI96_CHEQI